MVVVTIEEAQKRLNELLSDVASGEEVVIYRDDVPLGRLVPVSESSVTTPEPMTLSRRSFGHFAGRMKIADDFDAPLEDFAEYM